MFDEWMHNVNEELIHDKLIDKCMYVIKITQDFTDTDK